MARKEQVGQAQATVETTEAPVVKAEAKKSTSEVAKITLDAYAAKRGVSLGTIASFKIEEGKKAEGERTAEEWKKALEAQSKRKYQVYEGVK